MKSLLDGRFMKKMLAFLLLITCCALIDIYLREEFVFAQKIGKKKLYISTIKAKEAPDQFALRIKEGVKLALLEGYGDRYHILDDDAVKVMFKQAEAILASGCDDTSCMTQIADGLNADEIVYGEVRKLGGVINISLTVLERDRKVLVLSTKNIVLIECQESQIDHYAREAGKKLVDIGYHIQKPPDKIEGKISLRAIETEKIVEIKGIKGIEGLGIAMLRFTTPDESIANILTVLKNHVKEGDASFHKGDYDGAIEIYSKIFERVESAIRPESRKKLETFMMEVRKRIEAAYSKSYKSRIDAAEKILSAGDYINARKAFENVLVDIDKRLINTNLPAMKELYAGLKIRMDAAWTGQLKKEIEIIDSRLKERESGDEKFLKSILDSYSDIESTLSKIPADYRGEGVYGIRKALNDRKDSVIVTIAVLYHKKGDSSYSEYRFENSKKEYDSALAWSQVINDSSKRETMVNNSFEKLEACHTTGKNYLENRVKSFVDRAEIYNLEEKPSEAKSMMRQAYSLINGPMSVFVTDECIILFNSMARVMRIESISAEKESYLYESIIAEKQRLNLLKFRKMGGGKTKILGGIEFVYIPDGEFLMGSSYLEGEVNEHPQHRVRLNGFWIGKYEITQVQYKSLMGNNISYFEGDDNPVEQVSWEDAVDFCKRFSIRYNVKLRLPSEAEWEYACRAGTLTRYYWGEKINDEYCWYDRNSSRKTQKVGSKKANQWGLFDMSGNVWEWCADWYGDHYYSKSQEVNPLGPPTGEYRVIRGGSWSNNSSIIRSTHRSGTSPDSRYGDNGFRVVLSNP